MLKKECILQLKIALPKISKASPSGWFKNCLSCAANPCEISLVNKLVLLVLSLELILDPFESRGGPLLPKGTAAFHLHFL